MRVTTIINSVAYAKEKGFQEDPAVKKLLDKLMPLLEDDINNGHPEPSKNTAAAVVDLNRHFNKVYDTDFYF